jgi:WD40 repeat protein
LRGWDLRVVRSEELYVVDGHRAISGLAIGGNRYLAMNSYDNALRIFEKDTTELVKLVHTMKGQRSKNWPIRSCFSQSTGNLPVMVASGSATNECFIYGYLPYSSSHLASPEKLMPIQQLHGHTGSVYACDFSIDNHLATCSADSTLKIWWRRLNQ